MKIVIYGAGKMGRSVASMLSKKENIQIINFCDRVKQGEIIFDGGKAESISVEDLKALNDDYSVVIAISDEKEVMKVKTMLLNMGMCVIPVEKILYGAEDIVKSYRNMVADFHIEQMDDYFDSAESESSLSLFWNEDGNFKKLFNKLNTNKIVELACGRGRHVPKYKDKSEEIMLVDILEKNIDYCKKRFVGENNIQYYVNNGYNLEELPDSHYTALFTYDAMVHFEMIDIFEYLKETRRILVNGGRALFHHSNNTEDYKITFSTGTSGRNYMSKSLFAYLANRAGLEVIEQQVIDWGKEKDLDCITLVEKRE